MPVPSRLLSLTLAVASIATRATSDAAGIRTTASTPQSGLEAAFVDRSVRPGDDFFRYANGTWLGTTKIPPDRAAWGASGELEERLQLQTREILEAAARSNAP